MPTDIPLRCACGKLHGTALAVSPADGNHAVCYCGDCQAFARFLGRPDILDAQGGTDIFQMAPGRVRITASETLQCMRLSEKGLYRWYCGECKTPVGNTVGPRLPFVGLVHNFMDHASHGHPRDEALGPPIAHVYKKTALGRIPPHPTDLSTPRLLARLTRLLLKWWLTRAGAPSPFFDERGAPRSAPQVLTPEQRSAFSSPG